MLECGKIQWNEISINIKLYKNLLKKNSNIKNALRTINTIIKVQSSFAIIGMMGYIIYNNRKNGRNYKVKAFDLCQKLHVL